MADTVDPFAEYGADFANTGKAMELALNPKPDDATETKPAATPAAVPATPPEVTSTSSPEDDVETGNLLEGANAEPEAKPVDTGVGVGTPPPVVLVEDFNAIQLSAHARPQTAEAFGKVKTLANQQIDAIRAELTEARQQLEQAKVAAESAGKLPVEVETELTELREFRDRMALRGDPAFESKFSAPVTRAEESIYLALTEAGATTEHIDKIKKLGGLEGVNIPDLLDSVANPSHRRRLESLLRRREDAIVARDEAQKHAEKNAGEFAKTRASEAKAEADRRQAETVKSLTASLDSLPDFKPIKAPHGANSKVLASIEKTNEFLRDVIDSTQFLVKDASPDSLTKLGTAAARSFIFRARYNSASAANKQLRAQNAELQKQLAALSGASSTSGARTVLTTTRPPTSEPLAFGASTDQAFLSYEKARAANS